METVLIVITLVEVLVVIAVLAVYLVKIAAVLRNVSKTLGLITFGVRAIDKQTSHIAPTLRDINAGLERAAAVLDEAQPDRGAGTSPGASAANSP